MITQNCIATTIFSDGGQLDVTFCQYEPLVPYNVQVVAPPDVLLPAEPPKLVKPPGQNFSVLTDGGEDQSPGSMIEFNETSTKENSQKPVVSPPAFGAPGTGKRVVLPSIDSSVTVKKQEASVIAPPAQNVTVVPGKFLKQKRLLKN